MSFAMVFAFLAVFAVKLRWVCAINLSHSHLTDGQNHLAESLSRPKPSVCIGDLLHGEDAVDDRAESSGLQGTTKSIVERAHDFSLSLEAERPQGRPYDPNPL